MSLAVGNISSSVAATWSHTIGSGSDRLLVVMFTISTDSGNPVTGVTYGGVAMTLFQSLEYLGGEDVVNYAETWYLANPTVGTANVVVNSASIRSISCGAIDYTGANISSPLGAGITASSGVGAGTPEVDNITTTYANSLIMAMGYVTDASYTITLGLDQTSRWTLSDFGSNTNATGSTKSTTTAGLYTVSHTSSNNTTMDVQAVEVRELVVVTDNYYKSYNGISKGSFKFDNITSTKNINGLI